MATAGGCTIKKGEQSLTIPSKPNSTAKDGRIFSAEDVVNNPEGITDPYLTKIIKGKDVVINPLQYTSLNPKFVEHSKLNELHEAVTRIYSKVKDTDADDPERRLREFVVFKPERMALHWAAILTSIYVKAGPEQPKGDSSEFAQWIDSRDKDYVNKVNEIYFKLLGIDHTLDDRFKNTEVWSDAHIRLEEIKTACADIRKRIEENKFTAEESQTLDRAIAATKGDQYVALKWAKEQIYRERANEKVAELMESYFDKHVFQEITGYEKKAFVPTKARENFVLSGGSATGKSFPMAMLCEKLAKGYDKENDAGWKKEGLDLRDAVHMKSEVMRDLLLEKESLKYGNRLFYDEFAHDERAIIRNEMFEYLHKKVLSGKSPLVAKGTGPIIIHDRRSLPEEHLNTLRSDGARLNMYYFNLSAQDALERNRNRGAYQLLGLHANADISHFVSRFVNPRNNIRSQETSARRALEMIENKAGEDILLPIYSTEVDYNDQPYVIGYADLQNKTLHIRRMTRLLDIIDNTHFKPPLPTDNTTPTFANTLLDGMVQISEKMQALLSGLLGKAPESLKNKKREAREETNAQLAATWLAHLAKDKGYTIHISTPHIEKRTGIRDTTFAEIHPPVEGEEKARLFKMRADLYEDIQEKGKTAEINKPAGNPLKQEAVEKTDTAEGQVAEISRYQTFLKALEKQTEQHEIPAKDWTERVAPLILNTRREYKPSRSFVDRQQRNDIDTTPSPTLGA